MNSIVIWFYNRIFLKGKQLLSSNRYSIFTVSVWEVGTCSIIISSRSSGKVILDGTKRICTYIYRYNIICVYEIKRGCGQRCVLAKE